MRQENAALKYGRILDIYNLLMKGEIICKENLAVRYSVDPRSIQRDIDDLRNYLADKAIDNEETDQIIYDHKKKGYRLESVNERVLTNGEMFAVCKILLESRSMVSEEMFPVLDKLVNACVPEREKRRMRELLGNERFHYIEPHHQKKVIDKTWEIAGAVWEHRYLRIRYKTQGEKKTVERLVKPVGIMFSEYYFYMTAFIEDEKHKTYTSPAIYRIDRIEKYVIQEEHFSVPYRNRFEEGELRKRIQFMYGGELRTIRFKYCGPSVESVLDRLPTAEIVEEKEGEYTIAAEVFGDGVDMWLRGQGEYIERMQN